jgi:hypothetical protein
MKALSGIRMLLDVVAGPGSSGVRELTARAAVLTWNRGASSWLRRSCSGALPGSYGQPDTVDTEIP